MSEATRSAMDAIEIAEFLADRDTGVLSLAKDDDAYGVPVSFDYDQESRRAYLRLGYGPGSQKREFVEAADLVSLTTYEEVDGHWRSVVIEGHLETLAESDVESSVREAVDRLDIPFFRVHERPSDAMDFAIARIEPVTVTGIVEG